MTEPENSGGGSTSGPNLEDPSAKRSSLQSNLSEIILLCPKIGQNAEPIAGVKELLDGNTLHFISSIHGPLPKSFSMLKKLKNLYICKHKLIEFPKEILELTQLEHLSIYNGLLSEIPEGIKNLTNLTSLRLNDNKLTDVGPILSMKNLEELFIHDNKISQQDGIWKELTSLSKMKTGQKPNYEIKKRDKKVVSEVQPQANILPKESETRLLGQSHKGPLQSKQELEPEDGRLDYSNKLLKTVPSFTKDISRIVHLNLSGNQITEIPIFLLELKNLKGINLSMNKIRLLPHFLEKAHGKWDLRGNSEMRVYNSPERFRPNVVFNDEDIRVILKLDELNYEERRCCCKFHIVQIDVGSEKREIVPNERKVNEWILRCRKKSLDLDSEDALRHFPLDFLPGYCQNDEVEIIYDEQKNDEELPADAPKILDFLKDYNRVMIDESPKILKIFKVLNLLKKFNSESNFATKAYEYEALKTLCQLENPSFLRKSEWIELLECSNIAEDTIFFSSPLLRDKIYDLWFTSCSVPIKDQTEDNSSHDPDDVVKELNGWQLPLIFLISMMLRLTYMGLLISYVIGMNEGYRGKNYYFTEEIKSRFDIDLVQKPNDFWPFLQDEILPNIDPHPDDYSDLSRQYQESVLYGYSRLVGNIRLRQYRSHIEDCSNLEPKAIRNEDGIIAKCVRPYGDQYRAVSPYGKDKQFRLTGRTKLEIGNTNAKIQYYEGPAFVEFLPTNQTLRNQTIGFLKEDYWVDFQTRAVFVDFILANDHLDIIGSFSLSFEFLVTGQCIPKISTNSMPKYIFNETWSKFDSIVLCLELFSLAGIFHIIWQVKAKTESIFTLTPEIITNTLQMILFITHFHLKDLSPKSNVETEDLGNTFLQFQEVNYGWSVLKISCFFLVLSSFRNCLYYLSIFRSFGVVIVAISKIARKVFSYLTILTLFVIAYSLGSYAAYGSEVEELSTFVDSIFFFTNVLFGDFSFNTINDVEPITGSVVIISYLLLCNIIMLNLLIALLNDTYTKVYEESDKISSYLFSITTQQTLTYYLRLVSLIQYLASKNCTHSGNSENRTDHRNRVNRNEGFEALPENEKRIEEIEDA